MSAKSPLLAIASLHSSYTPTMCHNIIDGRFHPQCGHFYAMATRQQDCLRSTCVFSTRHDRQCRSTACTRLMAPPARNPIRISPVHCAQCKINDREAMSLSPDRESMSVVAIKQS